MTAEKNAQLSKEKEDYENQLFANEVVIEELKNKTLKLTKASEKCKCKK